MKIAFYPGSFNPWHDGHQDVLDQALKVFDKIVILQLSSSGKSEAVPLDWLDVVLNYEDGKNKRVTLMYFKDTSIVKACGNFILGQAKNNRYAIIRGMRNEKDFCEEQILKYCYQDMGIKMPIFHIISDRSLVHYSSSAIKEMDKYTEK